jgi:succinate dehydrogenase/fumarate reductase flavoprotein subunit
MLLDLGQLPPEGETYDVVVVGAGGAGMSAALIAAIEGKKVLLVERTEYVGGTTALSAATTWIPCTRHASSVSQGDTLETAARFLNAAVGDRTPVELRRVLLETGPKAVDYVEDNSEVKYRAYPLHPDYLTELEGSTLKGRALEPIPFDGRKLGKLLTLVRPPIPEFTVLGGMAVDRNDIFHLLRVKTSVKSFLYGTKIILRHIADRLQYPRGTRLVMGNALIGRLLYSLEQRKVAIAMNTSLEQIHTNASGVNAVTLLQGGKRRTIKVTGGVILATGGFNRNPKLRAQMLPGVDLAWCPAAPGHTGEAHELALSMGAHYGTGGLTNSFWAPVSLRKRKDGSTAVFPHFVMDRAKPGFITVNRKGERFLNESTSYHLFGLAMQEANKKTESIPAYLIGDARAIKKYGIGMVRPGPMGLSSALKDGYVTRGNTLEELAAKLGIDASGLKNSVTRINAFAEVGIDSDFARGTTAYQRNNGDATWQGKNPSIGPLNEGPYYAVRLYPGDIGAATGFVTDVNAQVLDASNKPIAGLYAVGNDMHSAMGGVYTAPGITVGPGLVFGYIAARHAISRNAVQRAAA